MLRETAKEAAALMLAAVLSVSLCACGASGGSQEASDAQATGEVAEQAEQEASAEETEQDADAATSEQDAAAASQPKIPRPKAENGIVAFDDVTLLDDDRVTIKLVQFYEKEVNWAGASEPVMEKNFTVKVKNKTDGDMLFNIQDGYINDESVNLIMRDGNAGPAAGKWKTYSYDVQLDTAPDATPLESLDDLYGLEATVQTYLYDSNDTLVDERKVSFNLADVFDGGSAGGSAGEASASAEDIVAALQGTWQMPEEGNTCTFDQDTITLDSEQVTLSGTYDLNLDKSAIIGHYEATDGTVDFVILYEYDGNTIRLFRDIDKTEELTKL